MNTEMMLYTARELRIPRTRVPVIMTPFFLLSVDWRDLMRNIGRRGNKHGEIAA